MKKRKVWRCLSRIEHGKEFCSHSISVEETILNNAIKRAMRKVTDQKEALDLIISGLSYAVTGDEEILNVSAIEQK